MRFKIGDDERMEVEEEGKGLVSEFNYYKCPHRPFPGLGRGYGCALTNGMDADGRGWGDDPSKFEGKDYRECPIYLAKAV